MWKINAGRRSVFATDFIERAIVAIGWREAGNPGASTVTHLMALDGLARALIENYEKIDDRGRALLPLTRLYWPA